jgi:hypothetical protein
MVAGAPATVQFALVRQDFRQNGLGAPAARACRLGAACPEGPGRPLRGVRAPGSPVVASLHYIALIAVQCKGGRCGWNAATCNEKHRLPPTVPWPDSPTPQTATVRTVSEFFVGPHSGRSGDPSGPREPGRWPGASAPVLPRSACGRPGGVRSAVLDGAQELRDIAHRRRRTFTRRRAGNRPRRSPCPWSCPCRASDRGPRAGVPGRRVRAGTGS